MGEILGVGCSHGPGLTGPLQRLTDIYLRHNLASDETPEHMKDPKNWPAQMREEWGDDEGMATAQRYRDKLVKGYRAARQAIDEFQPDFVLIFGDDQYEAFREDILPPFCVFAVDETQSTRHGEPFTIRGHRDAGNHLASELIKAGFDVGTSWKLPHVEEYGHAFTTTVHYLDMDKAGFDFPVIPLSVNCYGNHLRIPGPGQKRAVGRLQEDMPVTPPPSPPPWRCYDLGREVARIIAESPWRAVIVGSSSWSHASLTKKNYFLWPDVDADRKRFTELESGEQANWRDLTTEELVDSGQHELLNWVCLAGAMHGRRARILSFAEAYIFNSSKCVALFPVSN